MHWPDEDGIPKKERMSLGQILRRGFIALCIFLLLGFLYCEYQATRITSCVFPIGEVTFHDKWWEDGKMYVKISCGGEQFLGYDSVFASPKTVQIMDEEYYTSILLEDVSYQSVTLQIDVSKRDAYWDELFAEDGELQWLNIEKILEEEELITRYCKVVAIYSADR